MVVSFILIAPGENSPYLCTVATTKAKQIIH